MSQSPVDDAGGRNAEGSYLEGWLATEQQVREGRSWSGYERHCAFLNLGNTRFVDASSVAGLDFAEDGRALGVSDWDGDGDLDLWLRNRTSPGLRFMRNDLDRRERSVSLELRGEGQNTAAIGARVELHASGTPFPMQRRTVRAGSAYLSQSSRRLHFGLGDAGRVERVVVHWPGGEAEEIEGVEAGGRYVVHQGEGQASALPRRRGVRLRAEPLGKARTSDAAVLNPLGPLPLPELNLVGLDGARHDSLKARERSELVVFWATWCKPCFGELKELGEAKAELDAAGLDVLLVSVDAASEEPTATPEEVRAWLDERGLDFPAVMATAPTVEKIELLHESLVNRKRSLALPTSLVVDAERNLVSILRGPADVAGVKAELELAALEPTARTRRLAQSGGLWIKPPKGTDLAVLASWFQYRGFTADATRFLEAAAGTPADRAAAEAERLRSAGRIAEADQLLRRVLATEPEHAQALATFGLVALQAGQHEAAIEMLQQSLRMDPEDAAAWINLSHALSVSGRHGEAVDAIARAERLEPWNPDAHHGRAAVELQRGQVEPALRALRHVLRIDPSRTDDARALVSVLDSRPPKSELELVERSLWAQRLGLAGAPRAAPVSR